MSNKETNDGCGIQVGGLIFATCTAIIGQVIHGSFWWGIIDFFFSPLVWIKWLICKDVTLSIIKEAFNWFLQ